jgi:hypothetical protein
MDVCGVIFVRRKCGIPLLRTGGFAHLLLSIHFNDFDEVSTSSIAVTSANLCCWKSAATIDRNRGQLPSRRRNLSTVLNHRGLK